MPLLWALSTAVKRVASSPPQESPRSKSGCFSSAANSVSHTLVEGLAINKLPGNVVNCCSERSLTRADSCCSSFGASISRVRNRKRSCCEDPDRHAKLRRVERDSSSLGSVEHVVQSSVPASADLVVSCGSSGNPREEPLPFAAEPSSPFAYPKSTCLSRGVQKRQQALKGTVRVRLVVDEGPQEPGLTLRAFGSRKALGNWIVEDGPQLTFHSSGKWTLDLELPPGTLRFKLVAQLPSGKVYAEKQTRTLEVPSGNLPQNMGNCCFSATCVWGALETACTRAVVLPSAALKAHLNDAEAHVARLRERQSKLQDKLRSISAQLQASNSRIVKISGSLQAGTPQAPHRQLVTLKRQDGTRVATLSLAGSLQAAAGPRALPPAKPEHPLNQVESLFEHPSWVGRAVCQPERMPLEPRAGQELAPPTRAAGPTVCSSARASGLDRAPKLPGITVVMCVLASAQAASLLWSYVRGQLPEKHRSRADACAALTAAAVYVALSGFPLP
mmetsp:Transcript_36715/g.87246  ORF Transcript_36715/g.87246 Transcript_36715/m.87246 type:complete len:502 (-) Transcript_36715:155-1660(-)